MIGDLYFTCATTQYPFENMSDEELMRCCKKVFGSGANKKESDNVVADVSYVELSSERIENEN